MTTRRDCLCSLHAASRIFGKPRESIRKLIAGANLQPDGEERGHALYAIRALAELLYAPSARSRRAVDQMTPSEANLHWQGELRRMEVEERAGRLVPAEEVRLEMAGLVKTFVRFLEVLPDTLERDISMSAEQVVVLEKKINTLRDELHQRMISPEPL